LSGATPRAPGAAGHIGSRWSRQPLFIETPAAVAGTG